MANHGVMINQIPQDFNERKKLVEMTTKRMRLSADYFRPKLETAVRMWKIYYKHKDEEPDDDEYNIFLGYAFGMIEDGVSKVTEPILQTNPPCRIQPKRMGHQKQADNFAAVARAYYARSENQINFTIANKELLVAGNSWEFNEYANEWAPGKRWAKVKKSGIMDQLRGLLGNVIPIQSNYEYESLEEVDHQYPVKVGFTTLYPSLFDVFPQPGPKRDKELSWVIRQEREVSLDFLKRQYYVDPETGEKKSVYDLSEIMEHYGEHEPGDIKPVPPSMIGDDDLGEAVMNIHRSADNQAGERNGDIDSVHLAHHYDLKNNRIWTIANGLWVIRDIKDAYHFPYPTMRLRVYTPDPNHLYGFGMIEPSEDEIYELNDVHNMSFTNFVRLIYKMVAYRADAITTVDDFKPRAGGKIRVKGNYNPSEVLFPIEHSDVTGSMLSMESNAKGLIERISAVADFSPGTEGTKQTHKTFGGLMEIQNALAVRFSTIRRLILASKQDEMFIMQAMFSQFQFDPIPVPNYGPSGEVTIIEVDRTGVDTEGEGFNFIIEQDPAFGDDAIARNQSMIYFQQALTYENFRLQSRDASMPKVKIGEIFKKLSRSFGYYDFSSVLEMPGGVVDAATENQMMIQGVPVRPNPEEDLINHYLTHIAFQGSPEFKKSVETGQITPQSALLLKSHIEATGMMINLALNKPEEVNQAKTNRQEQSNAAAGAQSNGSQSDQTQEVASA